MFCVRLEKSITGIPVPGLVTGSAATSANATVVNTIFLICYFSFWRLIARHHVWPIEYQVFDNQDVETKSRPDLECRRNREIFFKKVCCRLAKLLADRFTECAGRAITVPVESCLIVVCRPINRRGNGRH